MIVRCRPVGQGGKARYGGRDIRVCARWQDSFLDFLADMGERPPGLTLERKNNDGNYEPNNCIWADRFKQAVNKSNTRVAILGGEEFSADSACRKLGISRSIVGVLMANGKTVNEAIEHVVSGRHFTDCQQNALKLRGAAKRKLDFDQVSIIVERLRNGETQESIAADFNVCRGTISNIACGKNRGYLISSQQLAENRSAT